MPSGYPTSSPERMAAMNRSPRRTRAQGDRRALQSPGEVGLISTEPTKLTVLRRHPQELHPGPFGCDPGHFRQINLHRRRPVIRIHHERNVLPAPQAFRQPQPAPSRGNIRHLPTGQAEFVRNDRTKPHHRPSIPAWVSLVKGALLLCQDRQDNLHGDALLHMRTVEYRAHKVSNPRTQNIPSPPCASS